MRGCLPVLQSPAHPERPEKAAQRSFSNQVQSKELGNSIKGLVRISRGQQATSMHLGQTYIYLFNNIYINDFKGCIYRTHQINRIA